LLDTIDQNGVTLSNEEEIIGRWGDYSKYFKILLNPVTPIPLCTQEIHLGEDNTIIEVEVFSGDLKMAPHVNKFVTGKGWPRVTKSL